MRRPRPKSFKEAEHTGFSTTMSQEKEEEGEEEREKASARHWGRSTDTFRNKMIDSAFQSFPQWNLPFNLVLCYVILLHPHKKLELISLCTQIFQGVRLAFVNIMKHKDCCGSHFWVYTLNWSGNFYLLYPCNTSLGILTLGIRDFVVTLLW